MKLQMCDKPGGASHIFRAGQANSYCTLEHGHPGECVFSPTCAHCGATIDSNTAPQARVGVYNPVPAPSRPQPANVGPSGERKRD